ncbi:hypothetical protein [Bradyrhizobium sp. LHD-71]|uniref:hypothetical protein n=1 Tax=Bradyrhizobium sp. LHD-71 TaxID=3072141 RepID=UPI00280F0031|nr:hypothetical protein [Bradyrhizobium sp. LHD-71]MDQ8730507.1 hypothetical protein [Bradyrhizobium sp. LHD-71]
MPDITKTRTDLIERAATELGVLPSGQSLSDEDEATIDNLLDPLIRQLALDDVVDIGDSDAIQSEYFLALARLLANEAAPSFGQQRSEQMRAENEALLRRMAATKSTREPLKAVYY